MLSIRNTFSSSFVSAPAENAGVNLLNNTATSGSWFGSAAKAIKSYTAPTLVSLGTSYASAGQVILGTSGVFLWAYDYFYPNEDTPQWALELKLAVTIGFVSCNAISGMLIKWPATYREFHKLLNKDNAPANQPLNHPPINHPPLNHQPLNHQPDNQLSIKIDTSENVHQIEEKKQDEKTLDKIAHATPAEIFLPVDNQIVAANTKKNILQEKEEKPERASACSKVSKQIFYGGLISLAFGNLCFSAINRFPSGNALFEFVSHSTPSTTGLTSVMFGISGFCVLARFASGYAFSFPLTRKTAHKAAAWLKGEGVENRWADIKSYLPIFGISVLNTAAAAFIINYSTRLTVNSIPYLRDYSSIIQGIAATASLTALTYSMLTQLPAVRRNFENWWYNKEDKSEKIRAIKAADIGWLNAYNKSVHSTGFVDAVAQGTFAFLSIIEVSNSDFGINKHNLGLVLFATVCMLNFLYVEYTSATVRGQRDVLIHEIHPALVNRGILPEITNGTTVTIQANNNMAEHLLTDAEQKAAESSSEKIETPESQSPTPINRSGSTDSLNRYRLYANTSHSPSKSPQLTSTYSPRSPVRELKSPDDDEASSVFSLA